MKDEINFKSLKSLEDAKIMVGKYIKYYNFDRPQWGLKKMTPVEYRSQEL
jgi:putative transposase